MKIFQNSSLKLQISMMTLGITLLLGLSAAILVRQLAAAGRSSIMQTYSTYATGLQAAISAQFFERYGDVQTFATNPVLATTNKEEIVSYLNTYAALYGIYDLIMVINLEGQLVAVNGLAPSGKEIAVAGLYTKNFSDEPWFKAARDGQYTEDKERGFSGTYVESPQIDAFVSEVYGEKKFGNSFTAQIKDAQGKLVGIISNRAGARWYENEFQNLYGAMKNAGMEKSELTLIDKQGIILVDYDPSSKGGDTKIHYDFNIIGKFNLAQAGVTSAQKVLRGQLGQEISEHKRKKVEMIAGFSPVTDRKFIPSLGWGVIVRSDSATAFQSVNSTERTFYILFGVMVIVSVLISIKFSSSLAQTLLTLAKSLGTRADEVFSSSTQVAGASQSLSSSSSEQAAALQQTVASTDEVSAMIQKNAQNAEASSAAASEGQLASERGRTVVTAMMESIDQINQSNGEIMEQIEESNREIAEIVTVINEIGSKTKVINDIVFQTKLLSFNASVEAARAGEQGKGFAVVAEEIGSLAEMSGNAAKEISTLLDGSISKVENIINGTKTKVEHLVSRGKDKVEEGTKNAKRCGEVLEEIAQNVNIVNIKVQEISVASKEQAQGIVEITKAMNQLDQVTQQNATASQNCSNASSDLKEQAENLKQIVQSLLQRILGNAA